jgi:hypothetical protein
LHTDGGRLVRSGALGDFRNWLIREERASELLDYFESIWRQRMVQLDDVLLPTGK